MGVLTNGIDYSWSDIIITTTLTGALQIQGVMEIEYDDNEKIENNYGAGQLPIGQGRAKIEFTGSITLYREQLVQLQSLSPTGRIQDLGPFLISVSYGNTSQAFVTDVLQSCWFQKNAVSSKVDDTRMTVKIPLTIGDITWG